MAMRPSNVLKVSIFPKLFPIPDFNISKTLIVAKIQRMKENIPIGCEVICPTIISPVTIAKKKGFLEWNKSREPVVLRPSDAFPLFEVFLPRSQIPGHLFRKAKTDFPLTPRSFHDFLLGSRGLHRWSNE